MKHFGQFVIISNAGMALSLITTCIYDAATFHLGKPYVETPSSPFALAFTLGMVILTFVCNVTYAALVLNRHKEHAC